MGPPHPQDLWNIVFFFLLCANPPHPQDLWNIVFFCFLDAFVGLCHSPPSPRPLEYIFFFICVFLFRDKVELFYVLNAFSPVAISSSQSLPHWSSVLQHGPGALYFSSCFATKSHEEATVLACLLACLPACLLACLPPCPPCSPSVLHSSKL